MDRQRDEEPVRTTPDSLYPEMMTKEQVKADWNDAFLTDIIVPHLRHIVGVFEAEIEEVEDATGVGTATEQIVRDTRHDFLTREVIALSSTITTLKMWRG